jgi:hypothetical protein
LVEVLFELPMNLLGLGISAIISRFAYSGYSTVASPNLLRLTFAFVSIAIGFALIAAGLCRRLFTGGNHRRTGCAGGRLLFHSFLAQPQKL